MSGGRRYFVECRRPGEPTWSTQLRCNLKSDAFNAVAEFRTAHPELEWQVFDVRCWRAID